MFKKARYEKALTVYARANKVAMTQLPKALLGAARCHEQLDQPEQALEVARALVALDPGRRTLFKAQLIRGDSAYQLAVGESRKTDSCSRRKKPSRSL